jgi:hypothetical protein
LGFDASHTVFARLSPAKTRVPVAFAGKAGYTDIDVVIWFSWVVVLAVQVSPHD